jgi:hypothetical protein
MDCERILSGFFGQPVNAVSSLAFVVCAAWIAGLALRGDRASRAPLLVLALAVSANAVGSFARHGPDPSWAAWAHDVAIMAILLFIGIRALGRRLAWGPSAEIGAYAIGLAAVGLCLATIHGASDPFAGTLAAGAVVGEIATVTDDRRRRPSTRSQRAAAARGVGFAAIALGGFAYLVGQTGSPLCRPDSFFQWHALWHVLVAVALAAYAYTLVVRPGETLDPAS